MWYIQDNQTFPVFTTYFHHSKEVFVCCLTVSLPCVFWAAPSIRGGGIDSPHPASQRAAAFVLTAAMLTTLTAPAFAGTWYIEDGDITISAGTKAGTNKVEQVGKETVENDRDTIVTNRKEDTASSHTVTINAEDKNDKVEVTLKDVNIDASSTGSAAVSVTGKGDTNIELDGDNELKSGKNHAGLEHNKTDTSGKLTIQDDNDKAGSLDATGGLRGAGIGGGNAQNGQVTITGGDITATAGSTAGSYETHGGGAGIGGGAGSRSGKIIGSGDVEITGGTITATGVYGAGIGGGRSADGNVIISGGTIKKAESLSPTNPGGAGIGGGYYGDGHVIITGDAVIEEAQGGVQSAGIGGGQGANGDVEISGNARIDKVTGGDYGAGIGSGLGESGAPCNGKVTIKDNAKIGLAQGGFGAAGIGGGYYYSNVSDDDDSTSGVGDVTIEGNTTVNAVGGLGAAGIGNGVNAIDFGGAAANQITIRSSAAGSPTVNATGGVSGFDEDLQKNLTGGAGIGSGAGDAKANITLEGKVTITATAGKDNVAIGDMNGEQEFNGLDGSITRCDSKGNDITLPTDPGYPVPADTSSSGGGSATLSASGGSAGASMQESVFPGLVVTDKSGQHISYTSIRDNNVLSLRVGRFTASLRASLSTLRQLRAEGIDTITFRTVLCSTTLSVDELLAMGGEDTEVVLIHHIRSSTLTVGGKAM